MDNKYETNISKYVTFSIMGQGYCGAAVIYLAKHNPSSTMVAIKKINMDRAKEEASLVQVSTFLLYLYIIKVNKQFMGVGK